MRKIFMTALISSCAFAAMPVAAAGSGSMAYYETRIDNVNIPHILDNEDKYYFSTLFQAIDNADWTVVQTMLAERENRKDQGIIYHMARAEYYLAPTSPRIAMNDLLDLLYQAPDLPNGEQIANLAKKRGATILPELPQVQPMAHFAQMSRRGKPGGVRDGSMPDHMARAIKDQIVADNPDGAYRLLLETQANLSNDARTEWQQRVAWSYYIENQDKAAFDLARAAAQNGSGEWRANAHWVAGLSAWRLGDYSEAAAEFDLTARYASNLELRSAGFYWASRAYMRSYQPENTAPMLKAAAQYEDTLYGLLAAEQLGIAASQTAPPADFNDNDWQQIKDRPNVLRAIALMEIGQKGLADDVLRHAAKMGGYEDYDALVRLARDLSMPQTQLWLAHNGPQGARPDQYARFPSPRWKPQNGWRVDPALVYAHSLQESGFRATVRSHAGAYGLMQLMPGTAQLMARKTGVAIGGNMLTKPEVNLELGQSYLESLSHMSETQGLLPKVIAAYNAPAPVGRWQYEVRDMGDPLLFIESIPYSETRAYVGIVLRNYWMYEKQAGVRSQSAKGLAEGLWPRFPNADHVELVQISPDGYMSPGGQ